VVLTSGKTKSLPVAPTAACIEVKRNNVSAAFYVSIEFQQTGYLVERLYKAAYGDLIDLQPLEEAFLYLCRYIRYSEFLPDTQQIGNGVIVNQGNWQQQLEDNKNAFVAAFAQREQFTTAFPSSLTPAQFVDKLFLNTRVSPTTADRNAAINEFGGAPDTSNLAARGRSLRDVRRECDVQPTGIQSRFRVDAVLWLSTQECQRRSGH
jgi:hypothetical protein